MVGLFAFLSEGQEKEKVKVMMAKERKEEAFTMKRKKIIYGLEKTEVDHKLKKKAKEVIEELQKTRKEQQKWVETIRIGEFVRRAWEKFKERRERVWEEKKMVMTVNLLLVKYKKKMSQKHSLFKFRMLLDVRW